VFDRLLVLDTETLAHHRDRGTVLVKLGQYHQGVQEWERYLSARPQAEDAADEQTLWAQAEKEGQALVRRTTVVDDPQLETYLRGIGDKLADDRMRAAGG